MEKLNLRYSEYFLSTQGEGLYVGTPSIFLRTFGCNFRCKNFGLPKTDKYDRYNPEVKAFLDSGLLDEINKFEDLPLMHTGCDTYASIYPEFKRFMKTGAPEEVTDQLLSLTPNGEWVTEHDQDIHLILTGGEPMLWQTFWVALFNEPKMHTIRNVTFETNGTQSLSKELWNYLQLTAHFKVTWSCSPKLSVSGEPREKAIRPEIIKQYMLVQDSDMYLKFVVSGPDDIDEVNDVVKEYVDNGVRCPVYLMPAGGCIEEYKQTKHVVADLALKNGYRFSPRMQLDLYGNAWGT